MKYSLIIVIFISSFLGLFGSLFIMGIIVCVKIRRLTGLIKNHKKIYNWIQIFTKITWRDFIEGMLRAEQGRRIDRPLGTPNHYFDWNKIQFNPVYLTKKPIGETEINTKVLIGPKAKRPMELEMPIILAGMAYGSALSFHSKMALGVAAKRAGTAYNSGNGPFLPEIRNETDKFILQLPRAYWTREPEIWQQADLIEIGLGHSAWGSAPIRINGYKVTPEFASHINAIPGLDVLIDTNLPENTSIKELKQFVSDIKSASGGKPIGFKFGCSHYLEKEMERMIEVGADMIIFDGAEGGTHGSPPIFQDHSGLPTFIGVCRAVKYLETNRLKGKISLLVGGGLVTPGDYLKCLALGVDAVKIGTAAILAMTSTQVTKSNVWEPPTELIYYGGKKESNFDYQLAGRHLSNYLEGCIKEMKEITKTLGKTSLTELNKNDLIALEPLYARIVELDSIY